MGLPELYATGHNAWHQLAQNTSDPPQEPDNLLAFTRIVTDEIVPTDRTDDYLDVKPYLAFTIISTRDANIITGTFSPAQRVLHDPPRRLSYKLAIEAANSQVAVLENNGCIHMYNSARHFVTLRSKPRITFPGFGHVIQLAAYETGFVALDSRGRVFTWGDERYPLCLGREVTESRPAHTPAPVTALLNLPTGGISKIAANGYIVAALTDGDDLYCWGGRAGLDPFLEGLQGRPTRIDVAEVDVVDVGVGDSHMIILTDNHGVFVTGDNTHGQLGIGIPRKKASVWTPVDLDLPEDQIIVAVKAGPKNSFIIVENSSCGDGSEESTEESCEDPGGESQKGEGFSDNSSELGCDENKNKKPRVGPGNE